MWSLACGDLTVVLLATSAGLQGSGKHVTEEDAAQLWSAQQRVRAAVLGSKQLMSIARSQLRVLLRSAK